MKFAHKIVMCNTEDVHKIIRETEIEWIEALLLRLKLDPIKIKGAISDSGMGNLAWRDYLVIDNQINILKTTTETVVEKHYEDRPKVLLGRWEKPEIVRVKEGGKYYAELRLKYWQLV
jgi:hypothetical protein